MSEHKFSWLAVATPLFVLAATIKFNSSFIRIPTNYKGIIPHFILGRIFLPMYNYCLYGVLASFFIIIISLLMSAELMFIGFLFIEVILFCFALIILLTISSEKILGDTFRRTIGHAVQMRPEEAIVEIGNNADLYINILENETPEFRFADILKNNHLKMDSGTLGVFMFYGMTYFECIPNYNDKNYYDFSAFCNRILKVISPETLKFDGIFPDFWIDKLQEKSDTGYDKIQKIINKLEEDFDFVISATSPCAAPKRKITVAILTEKAGVCINGNQSNNFVQEEN
ncbi:MAG: hypothetical protein FWF81_09335 [Defluviitaleaceae bacterium]|nr:hypothetical protein [Defluviitaleaceae bacterium]